MRHCAILPTHRSSATDDPRLDGIGHALEDLYAPILAEGAPRDPERAADEARDPAE